MPVSAFLVSRLVVVAAILFSATVIGERTDQPPYHLRGGENVLVDVLGSRWDTGFYVSIAERGYDTQADPFPSVPFFPLLPLAMRLLSPLVGDVLVAGILVSHLSLLAAGLLVYRVVARGHGEGAAGRAVWYLMVFPTSLFGGAVYSESIFLLGAVGTLYMARRGAWESAAMLGYLTALTRLVGIVLAPMLLAEWWGQRRPSQGGGVPPNKASLAALGPIAGLLTFMAFLQARFGDPLAFAHASAEWGRQPASPAVLVDGLFEQSTRALEGGLLAGHAPLIEWMDLTFLLLFAALGAVLLFRRRWAESVFVLAAVAVAAGSGLLMSQSRYMWVLWPAYIPLALATRDRPWLDRALLVTFAGLLAMLTVLFAAGYWVG